MKKFTMLALGAAVALSAGASTKPAIARDAAIEKKVEKTLARMTLDEKIGQMTEIAIDLAAHLGPDGQLV